MKKIFTLVVFSLFAVATIHAEMVLAFEMQTNKASGSTISLGFVAGGAQTVGVDWGDGNIITYTGISNNIGTVTTKTATTTVNQAIIKVYVDGSSITNLVCSNNGLISLDLSRANGLLRLTISNNALPSISVSTHTGLQQFLSIGGTNNCRGIDLSANTALTTLTIRNGGLKYAADLDISNNVNINALSLQNDGQVNANSLNACSLDSVYNALPDRTGKSPVGTIFVGRSDYTKLPDNDYNGSDATIATAKNWQVKIATSNALLTTDGGACITTNNLSPESTPFNLYPNPTKGMVQINIAGETTGRQLRVMDITGRLMHERAITSAEMTLDTSGFPKGVYLISTGRNIQKLVVE